MDCMYQADTAGILLDLLLMRICLAHIVYIQSYHRMTDAYRAHMKYICAVQYHLCMCLEDNRDSPPNPRHWRHDQQDMGHMHSDQHPIDWYQPYMHDMISNLMYSRM